MKDLHRQKVVETRKLSQAKIGLLVAVNFLPEDDRGQADYLTSADQAIPH